MGVQAREQILGAEGLEDLPITRPDHPMVKYAESFTHNFDLIAERKSVMYNLREVAKASLLAKYLIDNGAKLESSWFSLADEPTEICALEIPQLWNERNFSQIKVQDGSIIDATKGVHGKKHGVYGGVSFGLDKFSLNVRKLISAEPGEVIKAQPILAPVQIQTVGGAPVATSQSFAPAARRPRRQQWYSGWEDWETWEAPASAPAVPAALSVVSSVPAAPPKARFQLVNFAEPKMEPRGIKLASLKGVDLNLDQFNVSQAQRVNVDVPAGDNFEFRSLDSCMSVSKKFWSFIDSNDDNKNQDKELLRAIFDPTLSDRREEGDRFVPPNRASDYVERLHNLVSEEQQARDQRMSHFFSEKFTMSNPGPLFPSSWMSNLGISHVQSAAKLEARSEYLAEGVLEHILHSTAPIFDKTTEEGIRFRIYSIGTLEVRTTQRLDDKELVGAVFSVVKAGQGCVQGCVPADAKIAKATQYVEKVEQQMSRRYYVVLETEEGDKVATEMLKNGEVTFEENPLNLDDRISLSKVIRSESCTSAGRTVRDMQREAECELVTASPSQCKRYARQVFNAALGKSCNELLVVEETKPQSVSENFIRPQTVALAGSQCRSGMSGFAAGKIDIRSMKMSGPVSKGKVNIDALF
mmetsp:Transcript_27691/g.45348  ORF Transcript_27691/g.45348 Transcript_27691/m.45348 type:complete len:639 (+) Transcript_27691:3-1919(+)